MVLSSWSWAHVFTAYRGIEPKLIQVLHVEFLASLRFILCTTLLLNWGVHQRPVYGRIVPIVFVVITFFFTSDGIVGPNESSFAGPVEASGGVVV
jgi:hypothetical protein